MGNNIPWNSIVKFLKGHATPNEQADLDHWLKEDEAHSQILFEIQQIYSLTSSIPPYFYADKEKAWKKIDRQTQSSGEKVRQLFNRLKFTAAAVALLLVSLTMFWTYHTRTLDERRNFSEVVAPPGQKTMVVLPDSSIVWLNSGSSLKYNGNFNVKHREVLVTGEAFFDVKRNETKKFSVRTGILSVQVYGTAFNVKNYDNDMLQEITVSDGLISINDKTNELMQLKPGHQAVLNKTTNKLTFAIADPEIVSSWKNNELKFDNTPFTEMVKYMERWYGVNIDIDPSMIGKHNYTFKIKTETLTEILEKIKVMTPITYEINGKDVKIRYTHKR
jgi:ferric-dicitrate binding protein FerR (iron transport regulator)